MDVQSRQPRQTNASPGGCRHAPVRVATTGTAQRTKITAAAAFLLFSCWLSPSCAQDRPLSEYEVKARYLYSFPLFVEWPQQTFRAPNAPFVLGIVGRDPFGKELDGLASNGTLHGRKVIVEHLSRDQDLRQCQVLFISRSEKDHLDAILSKLAGGSVLTVSEIEGFSSSGGMIGLVFDDDRVRFEINLDTTAEAGLIISAKLSSLARTVRRGASMPEADRSHSPFHLANAGAPL
jgi:YfiR/HmsC-like